MNDELPDLQYSLPLNDCYNQDFEVLLITEAVGRISLDIKSPCPPGCIVLDIGQIIEEKHLQFFHPYEKVVVCKSLQH
jgi:arginine/lysine/ornithine decarboxylase